MAFNCGAIMTQETLLATIKMFLTGGGGNHHHRKRYLLHELTECWSCAREVYRWTKAHLHIERDMVREGEDEPPNLVTRVKTCRNSSWCKRGITTDDFMFIRPNHDSNKPQYFNLHSPYSNYLRIVSELSPTYITSSRNEHVSVP